jgi:glycine dehydrogenase
MSAMYAVYHGPAGLKRIAAKVHGFTQVLKSSVEQFGYKVINSAFFDTLTLDVSGVVKVANYVHAAALKQGINLRIIDNNHVGVTLDESVSAEALVTLVNVFASTASLPFASLSDLAAPTNLSIPPNLHRTSNFLSHPVFNKHHSETEMLRYINELAAKDLGLIHAMIPLGSCTMKLNSTTSMIPLTWPEFGGVHPFAPADQVQGYRQIIKVSSFLLIPYWEHLY